MKRLSLLIFLVVFVGSATSGVWAGTVIRLRTEFVLEPSKNGTATIYLDKNRMRIDSTEGGAAVRVIYVSEKKEPFYWLIDMEDSTYVKVRREDLLLAQEQVREAKEAAKSELKDLPPEQRREMEQLLTRRMGLGAFSETKTEYTKVATGTRVGQWNCDHYQGTRDGDKVEDVWAADYQQLGINDDDLKALQEMASLFESVGQDLPAFFRFGAYDEQDKTYFVGFPIMIVSYEAGTHREKSEVFEVTNERLAAAIFQLPAGVKETAGRPTR